MSLGLKASKLTGAVVNDEFGDTYIILLAVYQQPLPGETSIREDRRYTLRQLDIIAEKIKGMSGKRS